MATDYIHSTGAPARLVASDPKREGYGNKEPSKSCSGNETGCKRPEKRRVWQPCLCNDDELNRYDVAREQKGEGYGNYKIYTV